MLIFRHAREAHRPLELWRRAAEAHDSFDLLLALAQLECAVSDHQGDGCSERQAGLLGLTQRAAAAFLGLGPRPDAQEIAAARRWLPPESATLYLGAWEGLRYYALWPGAYSESAGAWHKASGGRQPVWILGLRSMGSILAPVAAAALAAAGCEVHIATLRPTGHPFDRRLCPAERLQAAWRQFPGTFLIADEGPGLSGSSFAGAVVALRGCSVGEERIALLPGWSPNEERARELLHPEAARRWASWRQFPAPPLAPPPEAVRDLSGGLWRGVLRARDAPAWPQHERRKFLLDGVDGGRAIAKFAGFGPYGRATLERARRLAEAGYGPPPVADADAYISSGWLVYRCLDAAPLPARPDAAWCDFAGRYLAFVASEFRLANDVPPSPELQEVLAVNSERLWGKPCDLPLPSGPCVALDARMQRIEWGVGAAGFVKFDGTDHHDDPFFPGPADIAWDLAAAAIEYGRAVGDAVRVAYCRHSGESGRVIAGRLPWHASVFAASNQFQFEPENDAPIDL
ncbi:MAG TPA: hypothetical protein VIC32_00010 [Terriglobales bacterium]|jgi:hypothetical protein